MKLETISLEKREDGIAVLTMLRDEVMNTLSLEMMAEIREALLDCRDDPQVRVVIVTGRGRAFCCGAELKYYVGPEKLDHHRARAYLIKVQGLFDFVEEFEKPVIAAINGFALGGGAELSMVCDFRIMSETARIGVPEIKLGVLAGAGGVQRLPRLIGRAKALEMNMLGSHLSAEEAEKFGLLYKRVPPDKLMDACVELAVELGRKSPIALALIKACVNMSMDVPVKDSLKFGLEAMLRAFAYEDQEEGMKAFFEKRGPVFPGRSFGIKLK